jgi:antirestriction protein ArdC
VRLCLLLPDPAPAAQPKLLLLPDRAAFHSAAALYATWAHEAIHSSGHSSSLARDLSGGMGADGDGGRAYTREELAAELGAVLLGHRLEIGTAMANHAAYLGHWLELLRESPRVLLQVLSDARRAADLICPEDPQEARGQVGAAENLSHCLGRISRWL